MANDKIYSFIVLNH